MSEKHLPLKTLFVLPGLEAGGAERVLIALMNNVNRQKYEPALLSVAGDGALRDTINAEIPFHTLDQKLTPLSILSLLKKIKQIKPDVIVSTMAHMNFAVLVLKPFFPKTTFIVREAITPSFLFQKHKMRSVLIKFLYKTLYPMAHCVLSPTGKAFDEFRDDLYMDHRSFTLLKNPIHVEKLRDTIDVSDMEDEQEGVVRFVACGRLHRQKGFDQLIDALGRFKIPYQWRFDILGEGSERATLEALIKEKNLQDKVFLKGLVMPPYSYFAAADCFLMPSRFEGLPNVVLESLTCGTPAIATKESGGIDEIVKDCPPGSVSLVQDMDDFIREMAKIKPSPKGSLRPSLLAECYEQQSVFRCFEDILDRVTESRQRNT